MDRRQERTREANFNPKQTPSCIHDTNASPRVREGQWDGNGQICVAKRTAPFLKELAYGRLTQPGSTALD